MRTVIVTASNEAYTPFLDRLLGSLGQWESPPCTDIACFDVGLLPDSRAAVARRVTYLIDPGWDKARAAIEEVIRQILKACLGG